MWHPGPALSKLRKHSGGSAVDTNFGALQRHFCDELVGVQQMAAPCAKLWLPSLAGLRYIEREDENTVTSVRNGGACLSLSVNAPP